jgi:hypothetical protein
MSKIKAEVENATAAAKPAATAAAAPHALFQPIIPKHKLFNKEQQKKKKPKMLIDCACQPCLAVCCSQGFGCASTNAFLK